MLPKKLKFLASLRLAVFIIVSIGVISAIGTIYEARWDAEVAQRLIYHSFYMYLIMAALIINLVSVMVDRWPWKRHHAGFVLAHVGIITLLFGSWITKKYGIDGSMAFEIGQELRYVTVRDRMLTVYSSLDGDSLRSIYESDVDFLTQPPTPEKPFVIQLGGDQVRVEHYEHFAFREQQIQASSSERDGPAIRFELKNPNVNMTEWLRKDARVPITQLDLGPAKVVLASDVQAPSGRNEIIMIAKPTQKHLDYIIYNKDRSLKKSGKIQQSETIETGWMGLKFLLLRYLPHAEQVIEYVPAQSASPKATSAIQISFRGQKHWLGLGSVLRLYMEDRVYILTYSFKRLELQFPLLLKEFRMGKYQGTQRASSYESLVAVPQQGDVVISMNEPLKYSGFTFYQSSFEADERGQPTASILSVNFDPGRWIKYLGSLLIVLGSIVLFYFKRATWLKK